MISMPQCFDCIHYQGLGRCAAFPDVIPEEIMSGAVDHDKVRGDEVGEVIFSLNPERAEAHAARQELLAMRQAPPPER